MTKRVTTNKICILILMFMYIFMFKIGFLDSGMVAGVLILFLVINNSKARRRFSQMIKARQIKKILIIYCCIIGWIIICTFINRSFDYSFLKTWFHVLIQLTIGILFYCYLYAKKEINNIANYIIGVFIIQTIIAWLGFISPAVKAFLFSTKDAETVIIADKYSGIRGLSLAGSSFFGLAIAYGLLYILYFSNRNTLFIKHPVFKFIIFIFLISGSFSAGRTGLVGAAIGVLYFLYKVASGQAKIKVEVVVAIGAIVIVGIMALVVIGQIITSDNPLVQKIGHMYNYVFEGLLSFFNTGKFTTSSSSELFNEMYFNISFKTFFIGDGKYTDPLTNGYYMNTDAGYMRVLLYGGLPLLGLMILYQSACMKLDSKKRNNKISLFIWLLMLVGQIKGEVVGFTLILFSMLLLYSLQGFEEKEIESYGKIKSKKLYKRGVESC